MKSFLPLIFITLGMFNTLSSCYQRKSGEITTDAEQITTSDSSAIVPLPDNIDSATLEPDVNATALQQDPPVKNPECNPSFILLSNPTKNHHLFQVKNFDAANFNCWSLLEEHAIKLCGDNMPCEISYLEISDITRTSIPPHYVDAAVLKNYGIGHFAYQNSWWELRGAKIWGRAGKGYDYYNSNRY